MNDACNLISNSFGIQDVNRINEHEFEVTIEKQSVPKLNALLVEHGIEVHSIEPKRKLEDFFMKIIQS